MRIDPKHREFTEAGTIAATRARPRGAWLRILNEVLTLAGPGATFQRHSEKPWASATFSGARHHIVLGFEGADAVMRGETYIDALPDHEFTIPGKLVADASIVAVDHTAGAQPRLTVEAELLVLDDS